MWGGVLSLVRQGRRWRRPRRRSSRVVDEGAAGGGGATTTAAGDVAAAPREAAAVPAAAVLGRAVLALARGAVGLDREGGGGGGAGAEEAWAAASGWCPARAADEVGHLMVRESLRYVIYA